MGNIGDINSDKMLGFNYHADHEDAIQHKHTDLYKGPTTVRLDITPSLGNFISSHLISPNVTRNTSVVNKKINKFHIEAITLSIGNWQYIAQQPLGLVAKWYFGRKKILWEILENGFKKKIEIHWSNLSAVRAIMNENQPGVLEVLLKDRPSFFEEIPSTKNIHTRWKQISDFTDGNALHFRTHTIRFNLGYLEKRYDELLDQSPLFNKLSKCPFPSPGESPFFEDQHNVDYAGHEQQSDPIQHQAQQNQQVPLKEESQTPKHCSPTSVLANSKPIAVNEPGNTSSVALPVQHAGNNTTDITREEAIGGPIFHALPSNSLHQNPMQRMITFYESGPRHYKNGDNDLYDIYTSSVNFKKRPRDESNTEISVQHTRSATDITTTLEETIGEQASVALAATPRGDPDFNARELHNSYLCQKANHESRDWYSSNGGEDEDTIFCLLSSFGSSPTKHGYDRIDHENYHFQTPQIDTSVRPEDDQGLTSNDLYQSPKRLQFLEKPTNDPIDEYLNSCYFTPRNFSP